ncbi:FAD-binding domain-containing protein [Aspergillus karnatakaensis]|uniref:FAD-binding domain-containing protein n=1 Tax=Aspergillus karnatakaensis TaxID=1810916 RepID=UPI003CCCF911
MSQPAIAETLFSILQSILQPTEILNPDSPDYHSSSQTWAFQKQHKPRLILRPQTVESLSKAISYLYTTDLDFAIYSHGFMSTSAKDVLVNASAFEDFHFDRESETVTIGAGQTWSDVYRKLEAVAPEYGIVGARTPCVGVAGTIVTGGYSWLSSEHGCISDPENMLDAQIVKYDGSVVWASAEPDLLWALRGGGGGFGVLVTVVLRVFPYPQNIWAGPILIPRKQLEQVADGIVNFLSQEPDPKITMLLYVMKKKLLDSIVATDSDMLVIHAFDANGEGHGRSRFQWALDITGAIDQTKSTTLAGVAELQNKAHIAKGTMKQSWAPLMLQDLSKDIIIRTVQWAEDMQQYGNSLADCTYLIFELLSSRDPTGPRANVAWPRPVGGKHILLLGPGCPSDEGGDVENFVKKLAIDAPAKVLGHDAEVHYLPSGFEEFHDSEKIWGEHLQKLQGLRRKYDPQDRFKGSVKLAK